MILIGSYLNYVIIQTIRKESLTSITMKFGSRWRGLVDLSREMLKQIGDGKFRG